MSKLQFLHILSISRGLDLESTYLEFVSGGYFFTYYRLSTIERNQHIKFHEYISIHDSIILSFQKNQDGASPPSCIFENLISEQCVPWAADFPSLYQNWCKNVDRRPNYGPKSKSKMAAVRHLGIVASSYRTTHEVFALVHISCQILC